MEKIKAILLMALDYGVIKDAYEKMDVALQSIALNDYRSRIIAGMGPFVVIATYLLSFQKEQDAKNMDERDVSESP